MRLLFLGLMAFSLFITTTDLVAKSNSQSVGLKKIVVTGQVPGPDLWRVTDGENELWILGTLSPLPKKMDWNSKPIEDLIKTSQAFMTPPSFTISLEGMGFFKKLSLAKAAIGIKKNPEKQKLKDLLPAALYQRWLVLKKQYMGNNRSVEKTRPIFASHKLFKKSLKEVGLTQKTGITKKLRKVAKKNKLEMIHPQVKIDYQEPKNIVKKFKKSQLNDLDCFSQTLDKIEFDLINMGLRAKAWSYGDIKTMKSLPQVVKVNACDSAIFSSELAEDLGMTDINKRVSDVWLKEVLAALKAHKSTFAVMPISYLLDDDGVLSELKSAGYLVELPSTIDPED